MTVHQTSIEQVKNFWNHQPCNIRHSPKPVGTREYFDEVEARKYFVEPHIPPFAEFDCWRGRKVLEIGCGIGTDTINFARHGALVTAVELSEKSLEMAKERTRIYGLQERVRFYLGNAEELRAFVPAEPYDLIYSFGVIHHTPYPERVVEQLRYYTHPGSVIKMMVYHRNSWKVLWILLSYGKAQFWRLDELVARYSEAQTGCPVTYTFTRSQVKRLLEKHGFHVTHIQVDHIFPYRISDYTQYRYVKEWYFRWMPNNSFVGWNAIGDGICASPPSPQEIS